jgi:hypothetical protein
VIGAGAEVGLSAIPEGPYFISEISSIDDLSRLDQVHARRSSSAKGLLRFARWVTKPVLIFAGSNPKTLGAQYEVTMSESEKTRVQPVKQFDIRLPDDLQRELNAKCALDGLSLVEVGEELVRACLANKVKVTRKPG